MKKCINVNKIDLTNFKPNGIKLVVELIQDHVQDGCTTVPKGTLGIIDGIKPSGECIFKFPHKVLPNDKKAWIDGHIRVITKDEYKALGRIL